MTFFDQLVVLQAFILTVGTTIALTAYTFQSKKDFSLWGAGYVSQSSKEISSRLFTTYYVWFYLVPSASCKPILPPTMTLMISLYNSFKYSNLSLPYRLFNVLWILVMAGFMQVCFIIFYVNPYYKEKYSIYRIVMYF